MKAVVVTIGSKNESLGAWKLSTWLAKQGWDVEQRTTIDPLFDSFDLWAFSCVFSWRLPELARNINTAKMLGGEIWVGGPAVTFHRDNARWIESVTGIKPYVGLDDRFEREQPDCGMTYFSRGCPAYTAACGFCPVPKIEGKTFRFYPDAKPARMLLDNNLSALPTDYQDLIIERYRREWRGGRVDANSGFEPHSFDADTLLRWQQFPLQCWRFGYDDSTERDEAMAMIELLLSQGVRDKRVRVYCLIGNEPIADCHRRLREIVDSGMEPRPQRLRPLNWRSGPLPTMYDWDEPTLIAFQRYYTCPQLWRQVKPDEWYYQGRYPLRGVGCRNL